MRSSLGKLVRGAALASISGLCGCYSFVHVRVDADVPVPEIVTQPDLDKFVSEHDEISVVLRVPAPSGEVLQEQSPTNNDYLDERYKGIENGLFAAGLKVIDRGLMKNVLGPGGLTDRSYEEIHKATKADVLIDILKFDPMSFRGGNVTPVSGELDEKVSGRLFRFSGWFVECRLILVESGTLAATISQPVAPSPADYRLAVPNGQWMPDSVSAQRATPDGDPLPGNRWKMTPAEGARAFSDIVVDLLKPQ